jgi:hypothetical protein
MSEQDEVLNGVELSRRSFMKKLIAVGFAVPVISSFALDGIAGASNEIGSFPHSTGNITTPTGGQGLGIFGDSIRGEPWDPQLAFPQRTGNITRFEF